MIRQSYYVSCDKCGAEMHVLAYNKIEVIRIMRLRGWLRRGITAARRDFCIECKKGVLREL